MAYPTNATHRTGTLSPAAGPAHAIRSLFRRWREKRAKKRLIMQLLSYNERNLEDMGLTRADLVDALGHDPSELSFLFGADRHRLPHV